MKTALLIPIYEPRPVVLAYLKQYQAGDFDYFLVVDDGSGKDYLPLFEEVERSSVFEVLSYPANKGKGGALKAGIAFLLSAHPDLDYIVTADSDGQHTKTDVMRVKRRAEESKDRLVLGTRHFDLDDIPGRSLFGKHFSTFYLFLETSQRIVDTQTGLRAIPSRLFDLSSKTLGMRFDYEMNFLLSVAKEEKVIQLPIETIYEDNNSSSHFRPIRDSLRIYRAFALQTIASLLAFFLDIGLFFVFSSLVFALDQASTIYLSSLSSRAITGVVNFLFLLIYVYPRKERGKKALRYALIGAINYLVVSTLAFAFALPSIHYTLAYFLACLLLVGLDFLGKYVYAILHKKKFEKSEK